MFTVAFWKDTAERSVKTAGQAGVGYLTAVGAFDALGFDLVAFLLALLFGLVISALTSLASLPVGEVDSPSVLGE